MTTLGHNPAYPVVLFPGLFGPVGVGSPAHDDHCSFQ